ncbi:hypothetical protein QUA82_07940 [Microcoleus sp. F8-D3]
MVNRSELILLLETLFLAIYIYMEYAVISCPVDYPQYGRGGLTNNILPTISNLKKPPGFYITVNRSDMI